MATRRNRTNPFQTSVYVGGNVAYDLHSGSAAPELQPERERRSEEERLSETHLRRAKRTRPQVVLRPQQKISLTAIAGFVVVAMLAIGVLASYIQLNSIYADTVSAQSELTELESTYVKLQAEDEEIFDSATLNQAAEEANLKKPGMSQQVYLELSDPDNTVVYQQTEQATGLRGCLQAIQSFFAGVGAYFS